MSSQEILLGVNSELGPIDPQFTVGGVGSVPCEFIAKDPKYDKSVQLMAEAAVDRTKALAQKILKSGMLQGKPDSDIDDVIEKLSSSTTYNSHGAVIDYSEAKELNLNVTWLPPESEHWRRLWLIYCCYDYDTKINSYGKIIEGKRYSISRDASSP